MATEINFYSSSEGDESSAEGNEVFLSFPDSADDLFAEGVGDILPGYLPQVVLNVSTELLDPDDDRRYVLAKGQALVTAWRAHDGFHQMPVSVSTEFHEGTEAFFASPAGRGEVLERRRFHWGAKLSKVLVWATARPPIETTVLDLSTGSMRCVVEDGAWPSDKKFINAELTVDSGTIELEGRVVRRICKDGNAELGIEFGTVSEKNAAPIRRHLFSVQRAAAK